MNTGPCFQEPLPEFQGKCCECAGGEGPRYNVTCAQVCPGGRSAPEYCCSTAFGPNCQTCPGSYDYCQWAGGCYEVVCSGHGTCNGAGTTGGTGICTCDAGWGGDGCAENRAGTSCAGGQGSVIDGACCTCGMGFGDACTGFNGCASWQGPGPCCCGTTCGSNGPDPHKCSMCQLNPPAPAPEVEMQ